MILYRGFDCGEVLTDFVRQTPRRVAAIVFIVKRGVADGHKQSNSYSHHSPRVFSVTKTPLVHPGGPVCCHAREQ